MVWMTASSHQQWRFQPLYIEVNAPNQETERSCICVLGISILPLFPRNFDEILVD